MAFLSLDYIKQVEPQILHFWPKLTKDQQQALMQELNHIDLEVLAKQKQLIRDSSVSTAADFNAFKGFSFSGNEEDKFRGWDLIRQGRLGCLLLAGGQGTRLGFSGPKGLFPISVIKQKSLFQLCAEKVAAAGKQAGCPLNLAIMTSPENDSEIRSFFHQHAYFGLDSSQVAFFLQNTLPLLDERGHLFLESPCQLSKGPDGNGNSLLHFVQSGIWDKWADQGIDYVHVILIDNPLADPFDAELVGFHERLQVEATLKCTEKHQAEEKVGVLVMRDKHCRVVEYSELPDTEKTARRADERLKHCCANLSLFCFSMSFIQRLASEHIRLPLHKAWKAVRYVDENGIMQLAQHPIAWKFETFIFDCLIYTDKVAALLYPRAQCFAPLKNVAGPDSPATVRSALQQRDREIIQSLTGLPAPTFPFELAAEFHYPTHSLISKWKGCSLQESSYVTP